MSLRIIRAASEAELSDDLHLARLLVLLRAASGRRRTKTVAGIMKLAKLDFLLRYPTCLERALTALGKDAAMAAVRPHERDSIESKMIRFRYGPWDKRYRRWIGLLVARGLAHARVEGRTVMIGLTPAGQAAAEAVGRLEDFADLSGRSEVIEKAVGQLSATRLKDKIYEWFPELTDMRWGKEIDL